MALVNYDLGGIGVQLKKVLIDLCDVWQIKQTQTLTNKTLTSPAVTGLTGTLTSPTITTPTITGATSWTGSTSHTVLQTAEHGAGAIGTAVAPKTYRGTKNGEIITQIKVDLTGLGITGVTQGYAIGLAAGAAYIGRNVVATNGVIYKIEMSCLETPAKASGTAVELDIDLGSQTSGTIKYGEDVDADVIAAGLDWAAGTTIEQLAPSLTANDYLYLTAGDTAGNVGVYGAGMFLITMYGHPVLT